MIKIRKKEPFIILFVETEIKKQKNNKDLLKKEN